MGKTMWTQAEAIALCKQIEAIAPSFGLHVALTGGLLYKEGPRKDADILLYRVRDITPLEINWTAFFKALSDQLGIQQDPRHDYGWCKKATWQGQNIDFFNPDDDGSYGDQDDDQAFSDDFGLEVNP